MLEDTRNQGEMLEIQAQALNELGEPILLTSEWSAVLGVCRNAVNGTRVATVELTVANGIVSGEANTDDFYPGDYFYDVRFTDPDGKDYWSDPVHLTMKPRNAPSSDPAL